MLVPIVFITAFMLALAGALLENGARDATAGFHAAVARYSDSTIADGVADFSRGLARFVAANGASGPWPRQISSSARRSACPAAQAACPVQYVVSAAITSASTAGPNASGSDTATNLQTSAIGEERLSAVVTTTLFGRSGAPLGARTRYITYRVFAAAPYAIVSGVRDIATVDGTQSAAQGDSGGADLSSATAVPSDSGTFDDTRIHVQLSCSTVIAKVVPFANDQQPAGNDALPWGNAAQSAYEVPCTSTDAPADAFRTEHWTNGDANRSGWTQ